MLRRLLQIQKDSKWEPLREEDIQLMEKALDYKFF